MLTLCSCGVNKTFFHYSCLLQWLAKHSYCPACRYARLKIVALFVFSCWWFFVVVVVEFFSFFLMFSLLFCFSLGGGVLAFLSLVLRCLFVCLLVALHFCHTPGCIYAMLLALRRTHFLDERNNQSRLVFSFPRNVGVFQDRDDYESRMYKYHHHQFPLDDYESRMFKYHHQFPLFTLSSFLDKPGSLDCSLLPPGTCLHVFVSQRVKYYLHCWSTPIAFCRLSLSRFRR